MSQLPPSRGDQAEIRTFLIADVRGYTRYTQGHGDEAAARLASAFADTVQLTRRSEHDQRLVASQLDQPSAQLLDR
jgi:class 3 adenylate cyclase